MLIKNEATDAYPNQQSAIDIFKDLWFSAMPNGSGLQAGSAPHFEDTRVTWAANVLGGLCGKSILELGPFEAYNTYQFETMGAADVVSIENNPVNFLKCLIVKNAFHMRSNFLHGDFIKYLEGSEKKYDICWASGILYHMTDPIRLMEGISRVSSQVFYWTQYFDEEVISADEEKKKFFFPENNIFANYRGRNIELHYRSYIETRSDFFSGGSESYSYWMKKDDINFILESLGYNKIVMGIDNPMHPPGPACFFLAMR